MMAGKKKRKKDKQRKAMVRGSEAQRADKHRLYEASVQEVDPDISLLSRIFRGEYGRPPRLLREDFCGTAALACRWVEKNGANRAWGVDLDPDPLDWGRKHNVAKLRPAQAARLTLIQGNVLDVDHGKVDVTVAFNFSYFIFKKREELLRYFRQVRTTLGNQGLFVLDAYGGADAQRTSLEERDIDGFTYVWDQHVYDPINSQVVNHIHFEFEDGSRLQRAFTYDWRLWTLPEIRELLAEAGFSRSHVYWEGTDAETQEGNSVFTRRRKAPDDPAWVSYIVGLA